MSAVRCMRKLRRAKSLLTKRSAPLQHLNRLNEIATGVIEHTCLVINEYIVNLTPKILLSP